MWYMCGEILLVPAVVSPGGGLWSMAAGGRLQMMGMDTWREMRWADEEGWMGEGGGWERWARSQGYHISSLVRGQATRPLPALPCRRPIIVIGWLKPSAQHAAYEATTCISTRNDTFWHLPRAILILRLSLYMVPLGDINHKDSCILKYVINDKKYKVTHWFHSLMMTFQYKYFHISQIYDLGQITLFSDTIETGKNLCWYLTI